MLLVEFRERADTVGAQELVFVQHLRQNPAQARWVYQGQDSALSYTKMARTRGVDRRLEFRYTTQAFVKRSHRARNAFPYPLLVNCRGAQRQKSYHGAHLEPL